MKGLGYEFNAERQKRYEELKKEEELKEKKLKALEIIKEMKCFKFYEIDGQYYVSSISVPKEKYDLLKEILL